MSSNTTMSALVHTVRYEAKGINSIDLRPLSDSGFPQFEAGSHIDLHLPNGITRSYSLLNSPDDSNRYVVGVLRDQKSRGGSEWIHTQLRVGSELKISAPRNNFPMDMEAVNSVLVAGGIGITPILCMYRELLKNGREAELIYCARSRAEAALLEEIKALGGKVRYHFNDEAGTLPDLEALLHGYGKDTHFYCCGPTPMLDSFEAVCERLGYPQVHIERFAAVEVAPSEDAQDSYEVELAKSGTSLQIQPGETLLERLEEAGVDVDCSCREGVCGSCEVAVLDGEIDHRDGVLTKDERAANNTMMVCVSGCKSKKLVLDL